jgi:hypothetical protein
MKENLGWVYSVLKSDLFYSFIPVFIYNTNLKNIATLVLSSFIANVLKFVVKDVFSSLGHKEYICDLSE